MALLFSHIYPLRTGLNATIILIFRHIQRKYFYMNSVGLMRLKSLLVFLPTGY